MTIYNATAVGSSGQKQSTFLTLCSLLKKERRKKEKGAKCNHTVRRRESGIQIKQARRSKAMAMQQLCARAIHLYPPKTRSTMLLNCEEEEEGKSIRPN